MNLTCFQMTAFVYCMDAVYRYRTNYYQNFFKYRHNLERHKVERNSVSDPHKFHADPDPRRTLKKNNYKFFLKLNQSFKITSVVEPEPARAGLFSWSRRR